MEPATYTDIWENYIKHRSSLVQLLALNFSSPSIPNPERMVYDLRFATAMARLHYRRRSEPLPQHTDIEAIWEYYKKYYNTHLGKAEKEESIKHYRKFVK